MTDSAVPVYSRPAMRIAVPDLISNSYFPVIAASELGFFAAEGLDVSVELLFPVSKAYEALRDGSIAFVGGSAHSALAAFPGWRGVAAAMRTGPGHVLVPRHAQRPRRAAAAISTASRAAASARHPGSTWVSSGC